MTAAAVWRPLADAQFAAPSVWLSHAPSAAMITAPAPASGLIRALPPNVQLVTLNSLSEREVLLRLGHMFGIDEHPALSLPVQVDIMSLFPSLKVTAIRQVSLTNNANLSTIAAHRTASLRWSPAAPHRWRRHEAGGAEASVTLGPLEIKSFVLTLG